MEFRELGLIGPIVKALEQVGYTQPTPIQRDAIPPALAGRDVLGCAQTGTGKTCAFAAPILQRLNGRKPEPRVIRALVLTPTRELAIQNQDSFEAYGRNLPLKSAVIFGGVGQQPQVEAIRRGLDILVATPGRLLDLQGQGLLDLSRVEIFVLDEADRMLDMGFIHDVRRVIRLLPEKKQTLFFSATMPPEVMELVNALLHDYVRVAVDPVSSPVEVIEQSLYYVDKGNKIHLLIHLMDTLNIQSALVFSRTKHGANRIAQDLCKRGIPAAAIHGNKSQTARVQALNDFKAGRIRVLAATDIAARGIDIEELGCVVNYNLPDVPETYVHRIGRTGRAGRGGTAISFCQFDEQDELKGIEKLLGKKIPVVEGHPFPMEVLEAPVRDKHGRVVNAEDAEARAAAKERRRQRDAENKARAEAGKQTAEPQKKKKPAEAKPMPEPKEKKKPEMSGRPVSAQEKTPQPQQSRSGVRRGRLQDTVPKMPAAVSEDFYKPNPLDSDVIMDATARLLAPRKPTAAAEREKPAAPERKKEQAGKKKGNQRRDEAPKAAAQSRSAAGEKKQAQPQKQAVPAALNKSRKRRRNERPRPVESAPRTDRQKDSTEHKSLMRPYYINQDE